MAPAHIVHGSRVTTSVQPSSRHEPRAAAACRMATTSACPVGSWSRSRMLRPWPITSPPASTTSAPIGTSPVDQRRSRLGQGGLHEGVVRRSHRPRPARRPRRTAPRTRAAGHVGQHLVGIEVEVVEEHTHVHRAHAEVGEEVEVAGRHLFVVVLERRETEASTADARSPTRRRPSRRRAGSGWSRQRPGRSGRSPRRPPPAPPHRRHRGTVAARGRGSSTSPSTSWTSSSSCHSPSRGRPRGRSRFVAGRSTVASRLVTPPGWQTACGDPLPAMVTVPPARTNASVALVCLPCRSTSSTTRSSRTSSPFCATSDRLTDVSPPRRPAGDVAGLRGHPRRPRRSGRRRDAGRSDLRCAALRPRATRRTRSCAPASACSRA